MSRIFERSNQFFTARLPRLRYQNILKRMFSNYYWIILSRMCSAGIVSSWAERSQEADQIARDFVEDIYYEKWEKNEMKLVFHFHPNFLPFFLVSMLRCEEGQESKAAPGNIFSECLCSLARACLQRSSNRQLYRRSTGE